MVDRLFHLTTMGCKYGLKSVLPGPPARRIQARRQIALWCIRLLRKEISFRRNGFNWTGPTSCAITESIFCEGHYQDTYIAPLSGWIAANRAVIVNVGANIGDVALPLSRSGKHIILAIEPNPTTFARLRHNVRQNGLEEKITCCQAAISSVAGTARLVISTQPGNSELMAELGNVGFDGGVDQRQDVVSVRTVRLDELVESYQIPPDQVALVWSDTQGFESDVIESGAALWASGTPMWTEVWPKGLDCHGGTGRFVKICKRHFTHVLSAERIGLEPAPIASLESIISGLEHGEFTDALLIPPGAQKK